MRAILNRDAATGAWKKPADGWYQLAPLGEYPHNETGLTQVLDPVAAQSIVANFDAEAAQPNFPGLLVDWDHFSYSTDKPSEAAGWVTQMENREDGVYGKIKWTPEGEQALSNGTYRLISPVWMRRDTQDVAPGKIRPLRIDSLGVTNSPQLKGMIPLSNRQGELPPQPEKQQKENSTMKSIAMALGLAPEASEDSVLAEVTKIKNRVTTAEAALDETTKQATHLDGTVTSLKNRVAELEASMAKIQPAATEAPELKNRITILEKENGEFLTSIVETDLSRFAPKFKDAPAREIWKTQLMANRKGTLALLESLSDTQVPAGGTHQALLNRNSCQAPASPDGTSFPELVNAHMANNKCSKSTALAAVMGTHKEAHQAWLSKGGGVL